ncbi:MAG TPA: sugar transferase [Thermoanaerobaculia bacterium]|nr:sugar transferase [Thermoanaerobaculia bacterium]
MARRPLTSFRLVAFGGDAAIAAAALYVAFFLRTHVSIPGTLRLLPPENAHFTFWNVVIVVAAQALSLSIFGLYRDHERFREPLGRLLLPALFVELLTLASVYFLAQPYSFPRSVLVISLALNGAALVVWRLALDRAFPAPRRRAIIVGGGPAAALIADTIRRHAWTGVEVLGIVGEGDGVPAGLPSLGPIERLLEVVEARSVDEVILTPEASWWRDELAERIPEGWRADLLVWPSPFETMIGRLRFRIVGDLPLLEARVRPLEGAGAFFKRAFDTAAAAVGLLLLLPGLAVAAALVAATSRGGVFYRQTRVGRDGRPFELWKLRTMREGAEVETGAVLAVPDDPRVTAIGRALRGARLDEIPQLWNVLRGDMSLVGPRPERPEFAERFAKTVPGYGLRHAARPGLTGLAQVSGEYTSEPDIKLRYDLAYLNNWSFFLDLAILLRTLPVVLTRRGI